MREMQALVDEVKKKGNYNQGGFWKIVWCGQCRAEIHIKEECITNMKNRAAEVHQVEAHEAQPQMPPYKGRGRGRYHGRGQGRMNHENKEREYE